MMGRKQKLNGNERTEWGNRLEAAIAHGIAEDNGWTIRKGGYFADPETAGLGSTLDYIIESDPEFEGPARWKSRMWTEWLRRYLRKIQQGNGE